MTGLRDHLARRIALEGPLTVAQYMADCLSHPRFGYYLTRDPLGAAGDFTTAPEISQMFGELLGLWAADRWQAMGAPDPVILAELGPGRGTLMADALRAAKGVPGFLAAARVHLVETSPVLKDRQRQALTGIDVEWQDDIAALPSGPMILIANEFFDALPIRQFVRDGRGWRERLVGLGDDGGLRFVLSPAQAANPLVPTILAAAPEGSTVEVCPSGLAIARSLGRRLAEAPGAALIVDYGPAKSAPGDSLQAVKGHAFADPLADPGEADLTAHVDFQQLAQAALAAGAMPFGPVGQGEFLLALGIGPRAEALKAAADARQQADIESALARLTGDGDGQMGSLFKALALQSPALPAPPGFE